MTHRVMSERSYHGATSRSNIEGDVRRQGYMSRCIQVETPQHEGSPSTSTHSTQSSQSQSCDPDIDYVGIGMVINNLVNDDDHAQEKLLFSNKRPVHITFPF